MSSSTEKMSATPDVVTIAQTETEKQLSDIWKDVLSIEVIGVDDRFMDIGGNSLNLVEVIEQIKQKMGVSIKARLFFDKHRSTIAELSKEIDSIKAN